MCRPAPRPPLPYGYERRNNHALFAGLFEVEIEGSSILTPAEHAAMLAELRESAGHLPPNIRLIIEDAIGEAK